MKDQERRLNWFDELVSNLNALSERLGLDEPGTQSLREFVVTLAKDQYRAGNRSGIRWARTNPAPTNA